MKTTHCIKCGGMLEGAKALDPMALMMFSSFPSNDNDTSTCESCNTNS